MTNVINFPVIPVSSSDENSIYTEKYGWVKYLCEQEMLEVLITHPDYVLLADNMTENDYRIQYDKMMKQFVVKFETLLKRYYPTFTKKEFLDVYDSLRDLYEGKYYY